MRFSIYGIGYWPFIVMRTIVGVTTSGIFLNSYLIAMEMVGPKYRLMAGTLCQYFYVLGYFLTAAVAYFLNDDWKLLQVVGETATIFG